ncbi:hypothetical protein SAV31267_043740 [Streptomyces avermitilis]|uniref:Aminodeoxyfutalosine deaminase/Imidazolonepropionase-like composite domain-containing protein n=1 Tax=Streptomyces avermitilis TaxID=33903 RepID=A0A4D4MU52_STRAX|nr:hypothetical protein SAV31267_043740 [Streptomyces avermitilis]
MLTIHAADELRYTWDDPEPVKDGAVAVQGVRVAATGSLAELQERFPGLVYGAGPVSSGPPASTRARSRTRRHRVNAFTRC